MTGKKKGRKSKEKMLDRMLHPRLKKGVALLPPGEYRVVFDPTDGTMRVLNPPLKLIKGGKK